MAVPARRFLVPAVGMAALAVEAAQLLAPNSAALALHLAASRSNGDDLSATGAPGATGTGVADGAARHGGRHRPVHHRHNPKPISKPPTTPTTKGPSSTTTSPPTTKAPTSAPTTTAAPTTTTTAPPAGAALTVADKFTQLVNGSPMLNQLTVTNTSSSAHTFLITVEVKGTALLPRYLNVNADASTQPTLASWTCSPHEYGGNTPQTADGVFTCNGGGTAAISIPANTAQTVMVTTGSAFKSAGNTVTVISTVTSVDGATTNLPAAVTVSGTE